MPKVQQELHHFCESDVLPIVLDVYKLVQSKYCFLAGNHVCVCKICIALLD